MLPREDAMLSADELVGIYDAWLSDYPIVSIEDGLAEDDWDGWDAMNAENDLGSRVQLALRTTNIYTTNPRLIKQGIEREFAPTPSW